MPCKNRERERGKGGMEGKGETIDKAYARQIKYNRRHEEDNSLSSAAARRNDKTVARQ